MNLINMQAGTPFPTQPQRVYFTNIVKKMNHYIFREGKGVNCKFLLELKQKSINNENEKSSYFLTLIGHKNLHDECPQSLLTTDFPKGAVVGNHLGEFEDGNITSNVYELKIFLRSLLKENHLFIPITQINDGKYNHPIHGLIPLTKITINAISKYSIY